PGPLAHQHASPPDALPISESLRKALEQAGLRRRLRQPAAERFARVLFRVIDQFLAFSAFRRCDDDLSRRLDRERVGEQLLFLDGERKSTRLNSSHGKTSYP